MKSALKIILAVPVLYPAGVWLKAEPPNVLFILSDDHTSQSWGVYGGILEDYVRNENIQRLADEGVVLDNCFCTNSISVPSRATILTGQYSHKNRVYTLEDALDPQSDNVAKRLQEAGYQTALFGKWHLKKEPAGFDDYSVFHDQGEYQNPLFKTRENWRDDCEGPSGEQEWGFSTDIVTDKTIEWIKGRESERPFAVFCHFKATHEPWDFPERLRDIYDGVVFPEPANLLDFGRQESQRTFRGQLLEDLGGRWEYASLNPGKWWCDYPELPFSTRGADSVAARRAIYQKLVRDYLRCAAAIDENIGRLLDFLDSQQLTDNTVVIYVSDQGYFLGEHGFFDKRVMYEESLRMPMVVKYPAEIPGGTRNDDIILNVDFASILADYAGAIVPHGNQGTSFRANLRGEPVENWRNSAYYRYWTNQDILPAHFGIRDRSYKLIFFYGLSLDTKGAEPGLFEPGWEFYDLSRDPSENRNEYNNPQYAAIIERMKKDLLMQRELWDDNDSGDEGMELLIKSNFQIIPGMQ